MKRVTETKDDQIRIRVSRADKRRLARAAKGAGLGLSTWLLELGVREASRPSKKN